MIAMQRRISGRPQDIFNMRFCDIDRSSEIWVYSPFTYKTKKTDEGKNRTRRLFIGPRAQKILLLYLDRCKDDLSQFVFMQRNGKQYKGGTYCAAIAAACKKAGVPHWAPNQLRHAGGTEVRNKFDLDAAQIALGHAHAKTTEIYAKVNEEKAIKVAREIG
jgi:integrase